MMYKSISLIKTIIVIKLIRKLESRTKFRNWDKTIWTVMLEISIILFSWEANFPKNLVLIWKALSDIPENRFIDTWKFKILGGNFETLRNWLDRIFDTQKTNILMRFYSNISKTSKLKDKLLRFIKKNIIMRIF